MIREHKIGFYLLIFFFLRFFIYFYMSAQEPQQVGEGIEPLSKLSTSLASFDPSFNDCSASPLVDKVSPLCDAVCFGWMLVSRQIPSYRGP